MFQIMPEIFLEWFENNINMIDIMNGDFIQGCMCYERCWLQNTKKWKKKKNIFISGIQINMDQYNIWDHQKK